jgi:hypothetical protein
MACLVCTLVLLCAVRVPSSVGVAQYGPFTGDRADATTARQNAATLNRAVEAVGRAGGGTITLPAGTYYLCPENLEGDAVAVAIRQDAVTLAGAGIGKTILRTRSEWTIIHGRVVRGAGIRIYGTHDPVMPRRCIGFRDFEVDGGAGFTGHFGWPADIGTGDGWDITHKGFILSADDYVDDIVLENVYVHRYRGEAIYAGGSGLGRVKLRHVRSEDTNASTFNITASFTAEQCEFGKSRFWVEIGTRFPAKRGEFRKCWFHDASVTAIALAQGDGKPQPYLFEGCRFSRAPAVFGLYGGVGGPIVIRDNVFTDCGTILETGYAPNTETPVNRHVLMEGNTCERAGVLLSLYSSAQDFVVRSNRFTGRSAQNRGLSTSVMYGAVAMKGVRVAGNRFRDCRTPEQTAPVDGERPLFVDNVYENAESRDTEGVFTLNDTDRRVVPHYERVTGYAGQAGSTPQLETVGYPDGQILHIDGGTPSAAIRLMPGAETYSVPREVLLSGGAGVRLRYEAASRLWRLQE